MTIHADGAMAWAEDSAAAAPKAPTTLERMIAESATWNPPSLQPQQATSLMVNVSGVVAGDVATASHSQAAAGSWLVAVSANTKDDGVQVVLRNVGTDVADLPSGTVSVVVTQVRL